jgi:hypothetical protein
LSLWNGPQGPDMGAAHESEAGHADAHRQLS